MYCPAPLCETTIIVTPAVILERKLFTDLADLAAFANALDRRRSDYQTLLKGLVFPLPLDNAAGDSPDGVDPATEAFWPAGRLLGLEDSDILVSRRIKSLH
jgi:hypothetical protein